MSLGGETISRELKLVEQANQLEAYKTKSTVYKSN